MRKTLLTLFAIVALAACGGDDSVQEDNSLETLQEEAFARVKDNIVGEWYATLYYNDGSYSDYWGKPIGWIEIDGTNKTSHAFYSDGTYREGSNTGTYKIYKNPNYLEHPNTTVPTYLETTFTDGETSKRGITIDGGYLRLYKINTLYGYEYVNFNRGYKYTKR